MSTTKCCTNAKKISRKDLVTYNKAGVTLKSGEKVAASMIRNSRLLEVLMDSSLKLKLMKRWYVELNII